MPKSYGSKTPTRMAGDLVIAEWNSEAQAWEQIAKPRISSEHHNFLIICDYGDWSGFRTLQHCYDQMMENNRPKRFYKIVERL